MVLVGGDSVSGLPPPEIPELQRHAETLSVLRSIAATLVVIAFILGFGVVLFALWLLGNIPELDPYVRPVVG